MKKQRMDGGSVRDVKCENAGEVTRNMVDQETDVLKNSTEIQYNTLPLTCWLLDVLAFNELNQKTHK